MYCICWVQTERKALSPNPCKEQLLICWLDVVTNMVSTILKFCISVVKLFCPEQPNCSKGGVHFDKNESLYDLNFIPEDVRRACGFAASVCVCVWYKVYLYSHKICGRPSEFGLDKTQQRRFCALLTGTMCCFSAHQLFSRARCCLCSPLPRL